MNNIKKIQNKIIRIIKFKFPWESSAPLYKESNIFKLKDIVILNNLQFVYDQIIKNLPKSFHTFWHSRRNNIDTIPEEIPWKYH